MVSRGNLTTRRHKLASRVGGLQREGPETGLEESRIIPNVLSGLVPLLHGQGLRRRCFGPTCTSGSTSGDHEMKLGPVDPSWAQRPFCGSRFFLVGNRFHSISLPFPEF